MSSDRPNFENPGPGSTLRLLAVGKSDVPDRNLGGRCSRLPLMLLRAASPSSACIGCTTASACDPASQRLDSEMRSDSNTSRASSGDIESWTIALSAFAMAMGWSFCHTLRPRLTPTAPR